MLDYLKYLASLKIIYDNSELIIGSAYIAYNISNLIASKVCKYASECRCTFCQDERDEGKKPRDH